MRAYATNSVGTAYGNQESFTTLFSFSIGQNYGGGIIFYINGTGEHGLIAAGSDQSTGAAWGCFGTAIGSTATSIGTGSVNTAQIVAGCSESGIAARICNNLVLNGYSDWFLPSKDELNQMYLQKNIIGGFSNGTYWSSSESDNINAWRQDFAVGDQYDGVKGTLLHVRAVRVF